MAYRLRRVRDAYCYESKNTNLQDNLISASAHTVIWKKVLDERSIEAMVKAIEEVETNTDHWVTRAKVAAYATMTLTKSVSVIGFIPSDGKITDPSSAKASSCVSSASVAQSSGSALPSVGKKSVNILVSKDHL